MRIIILEIEINIIDVTQWTNPDNINKTETEIMASIIQLINHVETETNANFKIAGLYTLMKKVIDQEINAGRLKTAGEDSVDLATHGTETLT